MKDFKKIILLFSVLLFFFMLVPQLLHALPPEDIDPTIDPCGDPDRVCPIDGGLGFMIAAGVAYGIKRVKQQLQ